LEPPAVPRTSEPTLTWKTHVPATLAGRIEYMLLDHLTSRPIYGARTTLVIKLLEWWEAKQRGEAEPHVPGVEELRSLRDS